MWFWLQVSALLGRIPSAVGYQPTLATDMGTMQERITTTRKGSITSVQVNSVYSCLVLQLNNEIESWHTARPLLSLLTFFWAGYLCASWWLDRSCTCHHLCSFGRHHCAFPWHCWVGNLPRCGSSGFYLSYHGSQCCRSRALWSCQRRTEDLAGE